MQYIKPWTWRGMFPQFEMLENFSPIRQKWQKAPEKSHYNSDGDVRSDVTAN